MASEKWSQQGVITGTTSATMLCAIDNYNSSPVNKLIQPSDLGILSNPVMSGIVNMVDCEMAIAPTVAGGDNSGKVTTTEHVQQQKIFKTMHIDNTEGILYYTSSPNNTGKDFAYGYFANMHLLYKSFNGQWIRFYEWYMVATLQDTIFVITDNDIVKYKKINRLGHLVDATIECVNPIIGGIIDMTGATSIRINRHININATSPNLTATSINIMEGIVTSGNSNFRAFAPGDILYATFTYEGEYFENVPFTILSIQDNFTMTVDNAARLDVTTSNFNILRTSDYKSAIDTFIGSHKMVGAEFNVNASVVPQYDSFYNLGNSVRRFNNTYLSTSPNISSDARLKTEVELFTQDELNAAKQLSKEIGTYKFLDSIAQKGDKARLHIGMTVQRAIEIMINNNLNPYAYGFICYDEWDDEFETIPAIEPVDAFIEEIKDDMGNIIKTIEHAAIEGREAQQIQTRHAGSAYSFRYDQLIMFIIRGIDDRLSALENL